MSAITPTCGELDICDLCVSSPHVLGCPRHPWFYDESRSYFRCDSPDDFGAASYWVEETFGQAAIDDGVDQMTALREAIREFGEALGRSELCERVGVIDLSERDNLRSVKRQNIQWPRHEDE